MAANRKPPSALWKNINSSGGIIKGKWKVSRKVGEGAFGEIYAAVNIITLQSVAIKFELVDTKKQVLKIEVAVLRKLQTSNSPYIASLITCGRFANYNYMVMELLGNNISEYRRQTPTGKFSITTAMKLGLQMLEAIKVMHEMGFLHRDIKPSNFAMGLPPNNTRCYVIDFGLARRYALPNGDVRPERDQTGFRGTARYASIYSHQSKDLGRRDDLWSLFYMMIELVEGELPWRRIKDKDQVGEVKMKYYTSELVENLPPQFLTFMNHLMSLQFESCPDYDLIAQLFTEMLHESGGTEESPFDWETEETNHQILRSVPSLYDLCTKEILSNLSTYGDTITKVLSREIRIKLSNILLRLYAPGWPRQEDLNLLMDSEASDIDLDEHILDEEITKFLTSKFKNLSKLKLSLVSESQLQQFLALNIESLEDLQLSMCTTLTSKTTKYIEQCTQLRSVSIQNADKLTDKNLDVVIRNCSYLKELKIVDCRKVKGAIFKPLVSKNKRGIPATALNSIDLSLCPISKKSFRAMVKFSSNLTCITLSPLVTNFTISPNDIFSLLSEARNLTSLDLVTFRLDFDPILEEISKHCTKLVRLSVDGNGITDLGLQNVFQSCRALRHLEFRYSENVTESTLQRLSRQLPELQTIKLLFMSKFFRSSISEHSIASLMKSLPHLETLALKKCLLLSRNCFGDSLCLTKLRVLNISDCVNLIDEDLLSIVMSCPELKVLKMNNLNQLDSDSLMMTTCARKLEELYILHCVNFKDDSIKQVLSVMPRLFIHICRYPTIDLAPKQFQINCINMDRILDLNPNSFSHKILDRFRRSLSNNNPMNNVF